MTKPVALVAIRSFTGMTRLSGALGPQQRIRLSRTLADGVLAAVVSAGLQAIVITSDDDVSRWAHQYAATVCEDPGDGLSGAAAAGVAKVGPAPWLVLHADLPLATPGAIAAVAAACRTTTVIVPSYDGGTSVIAGRGSFAFSYGIGSFRRHYASAPNATVIVIPELGIDIDTPQHLDAFPEMVESLDRRS